MQFAPQLPGEQINAYGSAPMWNDDSTNWRANATDSRSADICAARAQVEAARFRQQRLMESGLLARPAIDGALPAKTLPGYTLLRELHRGGQGVVYVAVQESTSRQVAIKILRCWQNTALGATGLARFEREVEALSHLKHPNIVTIHDCGRDQEDVYLVMDYVKGRPLDAHVDRDRTPLRETLALFAKICDGVNAAHLRGIIHRDLKPGNILVDDHGEPRLLDFGLAKLVNEASDAATVMTVTGQFVGSLPWASPEQAEGRSDELDIRTDVYSLGVMFYQVLTGYFPYPVTGRLGQVVQHIVHAPPVRPTTLQRGIDRELETILLKCLAKEPDRRYQSAGELARDIRRYLAGEPIEARRDSFAYLMSKKLARYRVAVITAATLLLVVLCALLVSVGFWRQAERQQIVAQQHATAAQQSAERADREAAQSRAVVEFMREVLTSVEPENQGADVRLIQVLANASQTASQRFAAYPEQEAQVRELLGEVYFDLSMWREAEVEYAAALALWREHAGADAPRTLITESISAGVALNLSRYREVEATLTALLPRLTSAFGPDDRVTLAARRSMAIALLFQGRLDEAEVILLELRACPALADDEAMQMRLAQTLIDLLQWRRIHLPGGPERNASLAQEEALAREWIDRSIRLHGPDAAFTLQAQVILAEIVFEQGNHRDSADRCRALLDSTSKRLPECHDVRAWAMAVLANALSRLGEVDEPAELYLRRIDCLRRRDKSARVELISAITDALPHLERAGRATEGESLVRELIEAMPKFGGNLTFTFDLYAARFVSLLGRADEAESLFQSLLAREEELTDTRVRARLHMFFGGHLALTRRLEEAEQELETAAALLADLHFGTRETLSDDLVLAFITLYETWGRADRAGEYQRLREEMTTP